MAKKDSTRSTKADDKKKAKLQNTEPALVSARLQHLRMSPTKVRMIANLVKGMDVNVALSQLHFIKRHAKVPVMKLIESAAANAVNNFHLDKNNLFIKVFTVDGGPILKRWRPRAFGRAGMIRKRTSHLKIILSEKVASGITRAVAKPKPAEGIKIVSGEETKKDAAGEKPGEKVQKVTDAKKSHFKGFTKKFFSRKTG